MLVQIYNAKFKSYNNGYYTFNVEGELITFEEINSKILQLYDLKNDPLFSNCLFNIEYSEIIIEDEDDFVIFRIENLELLKRINQ